VRKSSYPVSLVSNREPVIVQDDDEKRRTQSDNIDIKKQPQKYKFSGFYSPLITTSKIEKEDHNRNQSLNVQKDDDTFYCSLQLDFLDGDDLSPFDKTGSKS
jgi:hypothetical protein